MSSESVGTGYYVSPVEAPGPGVLVLHSWWGLTGYFKGFADRLAEEGYTVLVPDLYLDGTLPQTPDEAEAKLASLDPNAAARLVLVSAELLRTRSNDPSNPIAVVGFSMGASLGLWLSARATETVGATVAFYGSQNVDFSKAESAYLGHFAEFDAMVTDDELAELEAHLHLVGRDVTFHRYPGTSHWFMEQDQELAYNAASAELAWTRTLDFLDARLRRDAA